MKTIIFASAAVICLGIGAARAESGGEDTGLVDPNTFFTELPRVDNTAPGARPNDASANAWQTGVPQQPTATTQANPYGGSAPTTSRGS